MGSQILLIAVNYKNYLLTETFLKKLVPFKNEIDIIIVDNESDELKYDALIYKFNNISNIRFIKEEVNLGYLGAINSAINQINNIYDYKYIIISNNDIFIEDDFFFTKLLHLKYDREIGIIAPRILLKKNERNQNPYIVTDKWWYRYYHSFFYSSYFLYKLRLILSQKIRRSTSDILNEMNIFAGHGSFIILTSHFFKLGGTLKYPNLLYCEEEFLARQCKKMGLINRYYPSLTLYHDEHQSTGVNVSKEKFLLQKKSFIFNYIKNI